MIALLLLAAASQGALSAPWWLLGAAAALILGRWASGAIAGRDPGPATTPPAEEVVATIYQRAGRLVLRRRRP